MVALGQGPHHEGRDPHDRREHRVHHRVEFEHGSHLYLVGGPSAAPQHAEGRVHWERGPGGRGVTDSAGRRVGARMDDQSFRASVFAEQKQVSAFSDVPPTSAGSSCSGCWHQPSDKARDLARADARDNGRCTTRCSPSCPTRRAAAKLGQRPRTRPHDRRARRASRRRRRPGAAARDAADAAFEALDELRRKHETTMARASREGAARGDDRQRDEPRGRAAALAEASVRVVELRPLVEGSTAKEQRSPASGSSMPPEGLVALPAGRRPTSPTSPRSMPPARASEAAPARRPTSRELAGGEGLAQRPRSRGPVGDAVDRRGLPGVRPVTGDAFEQVQSHRSRARARRRVSPARQAAEGGSQQLTITKKAVDDAQAGLAKTRQRGGVAEQATAGRRPRRRWRRACATDGPPDDGEPARLAARSRRPAGAKSSTRWRSGSSARR